MRSQKGHQYLYCPPPVCRTCDAGDQSGSGNPGDSGLNTYFPNPAVQAMVLLDQTENDLCAAMELALILSTRQDVADARYWVAVADALMVSKEQN